MKHCIIVKFKPEISSEKKRELIPAIDELFSHTLTIPGIREVRLIQNCTPRDNRYDLMIRIDMDAEALPVYDECEWHKTWKRDYGEMLEKKAIFDYEE